MSSEAAFRDDDSAVTYRPYTGPNGETGFRCTHDDGREVFITLNPSGGSDDGVPNVFVYIGPSGDVRRDAPAHHYVLDDLLSTEAKVRQAFEDALQVDCTPHTVAPPRTRKPFAAGDGERVVQFLTTDPHGLWNVGDEAIDMGRESEHPDAPNIRLLRLHDGQVITLHNPIGNGVIKPIGPQRDSLKTMRDYLARTTPPTGAPRPASDLIDWNAPPPPGHGYSEKTLAPIRAGLNRLAPGDPS